MKLRLTCLLSACSLSCAALAAQLADPLYDREILASIDLALKQEYDSALAVASDLVQKAPEEPAGYFLRMTVMSARYFDENDTNSFKAIFGVADRVSALSEGGAGPMPRFYHAAAEAFRSILLTEEGNAISGALQGRRAAREFGALLSEGVESGDALGIVGAYHYWSSVVLKGLTWIPYIENRRERGIREMRTGTAASRYMKFALSHSLLWCYYNNHRFADALALCDSVLADYPAHSLFLQSRMHILYKMGRFREALDISGPLLKRSLAREKVPVNSTIIRCKMGLIHYSMGNRKAGDEIAAVLLDRPLSGYLRARIKKDIYYLEKARKENAGK